MLPIHIINNQIAYSQVEYNDKTEEVSTFRQGILT